MTATDASHATATGRSRDHGYRILDIGRFWAVFAACLGLLLFRGWDRITHADVFAEGIRFIEEALSLGWRTLLEPYDAYLHTAPKLAALAAIELVPVAFIPLFINLVCVTTAAGVMASVSRTGLRWLIPSDGARVALALLLAMAPGLVEVLGNLPNLHWLLLFYLAILLLKDPKHSITAWEVVLAALAVLSSASAVVFLPLAFLRLVLARGRHLVQPPAPVLALGRTAAETMLFLTLLLVSIYLSAHFLGRNGDVVNEGLDIAAARRGLNDLLPHLGALFATFYFLHPFLGTQNTTDFLMTVPLYPLIGVAVATVMLLMAMLKRALDYRFWLLPAWLLAMLLLAVMLSIVRYWSFYGIFSFPYENWWFRYNFFFAASGLFLWFALLRVRDLGALGSWRTVIAWLLIIGYFFQAQAMTTSATPPHDTDAFFISRYVDTNYWSQTADELQRSMTTGCPASVKVTAAPRPKWFFVYKSPIESINCPE